MTDQIQRQKPKYIPRKTAPDDVMDQVEKGNKFIVVDGDIDDVPDGYMFLNMKFKGEAFKTLVPKNLLFYMANAGEGDVDEALDELSDFYGEAENYEDDLMESGDTNVQEAHLTTAARTSYATYLINKLTISKGKGGDDFDYDSSTLDELCLNDNYVEQRMKGIAAICLGKSIEEIKAAGINDIVKHVTIREKKTTQLTREEFKKVTCWAGSHYELKGEYMRDDDISYSVDRRHDKGHMVGTKTVHKIDIEVLDGKIKELENQVVDYWQNQGKEVGRHDRALVRQYINLKYIAKDNKNAQLDITPPPQLSKKEMKTLMEEILEDKNKKDEQA